MKGDLPVIELGSSLGLTTSLICKLNPDNKVFSVDANPNLISSLNYTKDKNNFKNLSTLNAAIDYSNNEKVGFIISEYSLESKKGDNYSSVLIKTIKFSDIFLMNDFTEYILVCDIEGSEIEILLNEVNDIAISGCKLIIIELHEVDYCEKSYTINELCDLLSKKFNMTLIDQCRSTYCFKKSEYILSN